MTPENLRDLIRQEWNLPMQRFAHAVADVIDDHARQLAELRDHENDDLTAAYLAGKQEALAERTSRCDKPDAPQMEDKPGPRWQHPTPGGEYTGQCSDGKRDTFVWSDGKVASAGPLFSTTPISIEIATASIYDHDRGSAANGRRWLAAHPEPQPRWPIDNAEYLGPYSVDGTDWDLWFRSDSVSATCAEMKTGTPWLTRTATYTSHSAIGEAWRRVDARLAENAKPATVEGDLPICPTCDEHHPRECMCPPHEVRSSRNHDACVICHPQPADQAGEPISPAVEKAMATFRGAVAMREKLEAKMKAIVAERDQLKEAIPDRCPVTGMPFFMLLHHEEYGWLPTYGGPYDSYTIPECLERVDKRPREFTRMRYDHDEGAWIDGVEAVGYYAMDEHLADDHPPAAEPCYGCNGGQSLGRAYVCARCGGTGQIVTPPEPCRECDKLIKYFREQDTAAGYRGDDAGRTASESAIHELNKANKDWRDADDRANAHAANLEESRAECERLRGELADQTRKVENLRGEYLPACKLCDAAGHDEDTLPESVEALVAERDRLLGALDAARSNIKKVQAERDATVAELRGELVAANARYDQLTSMQPAYETLREDRDKLASELTEARSLLREAQDAHANVCGRLATVLNILRDALKSGGLIARIKAAILAGEAK